MSDQPANLAEALVALQADLPPIGKNAQGQRSKYADLPKVSKIVLSRCAELGLFFCCRPTMHPELGFVLAYELTHVSGDSRQGFYPLPKDTPQTIGGSITYARRYALLAVTGVAPDEDDDDAQAAEAEARALQRQAPETRGDGSATEAEQYRMTHGPVPGVTRSNSTPPDDPYYNPPADAPDQHRKRMNQMFALYKQLGIDGKDDDGRQAMLMDLSAMLDHPVASRADLNLSELTTVCAILRRRAEQQEART